MTFFSSRCKYPAGRFFLTRNQERLRKIDVSCDYLFYNNTGRNQLHYNDCNSEKCYTHGCTEVESDLFEHLKDYRDAGNKKIDVVIEYPTDQHKTVSDECN